jgi:putative endonuclease
MTCRKGGEGEELAAGYLLRKGYGILARNYRTRWGEVDIVATRGDDLAFVEVKCWDALGRECLGQSIDARKRRKIRQVAGCFLADRPEHEERRVRFDVIFIRGGSVEHLENAF